MPRKRENQAEIKSSVAIQNKKNKTDGPPSGRRIIFPSLLRPCGERARSVFATQGCASYEFVGYQPRITITVLFEMENGKPARSRGCYRRSIRKAVKRMKLRRGNPVRSCTINALRYHQSVQKRKHILNCLLYTSPSPRD